MERVSPAPSPHHGTRSFLSLLILCTNRKLHLEHKARAGQVKRSGGQSDWKGLWMLWCDRGGLLAVSLRVGRRREGTGVLVATTDELRGLGCGRLASGITCHVLAG